jgi:phosphoenolpyruvate carboxylase
MILVQGTEKHGVLELALLLKDATLVHHQQGRLHLKIIWLMELL